MTISRRISAAALLTCCLAFAQSGANSPVEHRIHQLQINDRPALEAFLAAGSNAKVPVGLVLTDNQLCTSKVNLTVQDEPAGNVFDALASQVPGYAWTTEHGVVLISPKELPQNTRRLLELAIPTFRTPSGTLVAQWFDLSMNVRAVLKPYEGTAIDMLEPSGALKRAPISLQNATVKEILDVMVSQPPVGAWVLFPVPQDFSAAADGQFAAVLSYSATTSVGRISCAAESPKR